MEEVVGVIREGEPFHGRSSVTISDIVVPMVGAWGWLAAALGSSVLAMAVTGIRSSLLILGEEGLSEAAEKGDPVAGGILVAIRDPALRYPFSLWVAAALMRIFSALAAGAAAVSLAGELSGPAGAGAAALWVAAYLLVVFLLENVATRQGLVKPGNVLRFGGLALRVLRASALPAALAERAGRALFPGRFSPEALMDIRFGSEEGILTVIEEGAEHGTIDPAEERMIEGILRFDETTVSEEMTPRSRVVFLRQGAPLSEVVRVVGEAGYSRYPVLSVGGEEVVGILPARALFRAGEGMPWDRFLEKPVYVPESMNVADLFGRFRRLRMHMAVVIDEHGMLCGVITVHDLLEKIVGRLSGGAEAGELPAWEKDGALSVPAATPVRVLRDEYGIDVPLGKSYETAGGYAMDCLQAVPEGRVTFLSHGYRVTVAETEGYRIRRLRFEKLPATGTS
jgi:CBS domain containing-hemolysin-like protein